MPQDPNGPSTPPPRRVVTQEERQCVLTAYESCDEWLTVAKYNNMSRSATYRLCKTGDPSSPAYIDIDYTLTFTQLAAKV
ncbi:hypothetical protein PF005_g10766 [Phytophthora fragariae]|uniref:Uncharacterized protein n=1 Tax=Phytophthora fragariae TaxID=53985 RepID=A0A6A3KV18_9STRA|nr:hypothetical protein PF003_g27339 [Phytophthora fragariae]KAE9011212.1 hypothetical protein PF011_g9475 [Phytophthora fragariae]KAE9212054.1 hypothetical protein PF005_g10766 [Phytophthora fragariae]KAE9222858.1 hypothetical protein PF004_g12696 [Phytophthora fragariae]